MSEEVSKCPEMVAGVRRGIEVSGEVSGCLESVADVWRMWLVCGESVRGRVGLTGSVFFVPIFFFCIKKKNDVIEREKEER